MVKHSCLENYQAATNSTKLVYEAFPYSEDIFSFNYEPLKTQFLLGIVFIPGKNLRALSRAFLNSSLRLCP